MTNRMKILAAIAVMAVALSACLIVLDPEESDAANEVTFNVSVGDTWESKNITFGSTVVSGSIPGIDNYSTTNIGGRQFLLASGTFTTPGTFTITSDEGGTVRVVVSGPSEEDVDFTSPSAVSGVSGGSISYKATTNISATYSEAGGTGASWLNVNSSTGTVTGTFPTVSEKTTYTYSIKATSKTLGSNTATQTITINVYPVAKISATTTSIGGTEGEAIGSVSLSGNLPMAFSKASGNFPSGITVSNNGLIAGTPTESGSFTAVVKGSVTEGPAQSPTITIRLNIEPAEPVISITVADPKESYKTGESISLSLSSNVSGTTWKVSGSASSFMSVSGNAVVGSVPSSYESVTELILTVSAESPKGQTASKTIEFSVEPVISFTSVPTADCIVTPVYEYDEDGNPIVASRISMSEVWADAGADFTYKGTLTVCGTFTGSNAETVTWYWGDGSSDVGNKITHTYAEPGTYDIRLVASNELGESEVTISVTVGDDGGDLILWIVIGVLVIALVVLIASSGRRSRH